MVNKSTNDGDVFVQTNYVGYCGGIFGSLEMNTGILLTVENSVNNGNINGTLVNRAGGLIGTMSSNQPTVVIKDSVNNGEIVLSSLSTNGCMGGGMIGFASENGDTSVTIIRGHNNGKISSFNTTAPVTIGGFIGTVWGGAQVNATLSCCINHGNLKTDTGNGTVGGLVGTMTNSTPESIINLLVNNSGNEGIMEATGDDSFMGGLFIVNSWGEDNTTTKVYNSFNKGHITGKAHAYGIGNLMTVASNVVSVGPFTGQPEDAHSFSPSCDDATLLYGLVGACVNCESATALLTEQHTGGPYCVGEGQSACVLTTC